MIEILKQQEENKQKIAEVKEILGNNSLMRIPVKLWPILQMPRSAC